MNNVKNILFDMGDVLIRFDRNLFMERLGLSAGEQALLMKEVYLSHEWAKLDWGRITDEMAVMRICRRVPEHLHDAVRRLVMMWDRPILPVEGMETLIRELKEKGYHLYLLSNASVRQHEYWPRVPGNECFDGTLISADVRLVKPQPEIYAYACCRFRIHAEESLFIDDSPINVEGAARVGMQGIVFHGDAEELRAGLREYGVSV